MVKKIFAQQLHKLIEDLEELALIDTREEGDFGLAHILLCANISLSHLDMIN